MLHFPQDYPKAKTVFLDVNYRCSQNILHASMELIANNELRYEKKITTPNPDGAPVKVQEYESPPLEYRAVVRPLRERLDRGEDLKDTALLLRTNQEAEGLIGALMEYQVPFIMKEQLPNLFNHWVCRNMLAYLRMAQGDRSRRTFLEVMNRPRRYIARELLTSSTVSFEALKEAYKDKDWMCDRITTLETHLRILKTLPPYAGINFIRKAMGYEEYLQEYAQYRKIKPEELLEVLDRVMESTKGMKTLEEWESYIEEYTRKLKEQAREQETEQEGVTVSTLHGVKGLEYNYVTILNVNEGSIPYRKAVLESALEEERRLFYVGMTRAKKQLTLCYVRKQYEKEREPSRFLEEAGV
jgi:DNA helicase-2/ATP-dependent DNA helicase PcrA